MQLLGDRDEATQLMNVHEVAPLELAGRARCRLQQLHLRILAMVNLRALMQRRWCDVTRTVLAMTGTTPGLPPADLPLAGLRIVDLTDGLGELGVRYLADLGADVIRVEPLEGARS